MSEQDEGLVGSHLVRYGSAKDQKYLVGEFLETYDQLVINANIVSHMPGAIASFILQRAKRKPYFIDPQTHAFQHDISHILSGSAASKGLIKRSYKKLLKGYGEPVENIVGDENKSILPSDFSDNKIRKAFCERVLKFQLETVTDQTESSDDSKYYEFLKEEEILGTESLRPSLLVAPYFCLQKSNYEEWLKVNLSCAKDAHAFASKKNIPLAVQIVLSKNLLENDDQILYLAREYGKLNAGCFLVWIDSFSEQKSSEEDLLAFMRLVSELGKKAPVVNLYAGFFSILLVHAGILAGATHSLEYGEHRPVVPVGGGIPVAKYYVPALHSRLAFRTALRAVRSLGGLESLEDFHSKVCDCKQCKQVITQNANEDFLAYGKTSVKNGRQFPTAETSDNCARHYMWSKMREFSGEVDLKQELEWLKDASDSLRRDVGVENTEHCRIWADTLSKVVE